MKSNHITFRISDELRRSLEIISQNTGRKISEIIRDEIKYLNITKNFDSISGNTVSLADLKLFQCFFYVKFISFMYRKRESFNMQEDEHFIQDLVHFTDKLIDNPVVTEYLRENLYLLREDLVRALNNPHPNFSYSFPIRFDYGELDNFIRRVDVRTSIVYL